MTDKIGTISADETWGGSAYPSPINLTGDVTVASAKTVQILPGTEIVAKGPFKLDVIGRLIAGGSRRGRIVFRADSRARGSWVGIIFSHILAAPSLLEYCDILDADLGLNFELEPSNASYSHQILRCRVANSKVGVRADSRYWALTKCLLEDNLYGMVIVGAVSIVNTDASGAAGIFARQGLHDCRIRRNEYGFEVENAAVLTVSGGQNRIYGNRLAGATIAGTLNAENTWWGSDTGPSGGKGVAGGLGDSIGGAGTVDVTPWTELARYVPRTEEIRSYVSNILAESGTAGIESAEVNLDDEEIEAMLDRVQGVLDSWHTDRRLEKPLFARGTETNEELDALPHGTTFALKYRPIRSITSVDLRTGNATWASVSNDSYAGWFVSERMKEQGLLQIEAPPSFERAAFRVTYTHGFDTIPAEIRDAAIKLAALEILNAVLPTGAGDAFASRSERLAEEIAAMAKKVRGKRVGWAL